MNSPLYNTALKAKNYLKYLLHYKEINKNVDTKTYNPLEKNSIINYNMSRYEGPEKYVCFAPFTNLFFDIRGKVVTCNQNRMFILGDIHTESIREIWEGKAIEEIRKHLANFDFSKGCNKCADAINSKNYHGLPALSYDSTRKINKYYPVRMEFEMGNTCNLACKMCNSYFSSTYKKHFQDDADTPISYPENFLFQLIEFIPHLKYTKFTGGEPFLIEEYYPIWDKITEINPSCGIHIQTNGLILNNKVKSTLEKGNFHIGVSLDGATKESYEKIRLYGKFERLLENLLYFKEYCKRKDTILNFPFTPTRDTLYEVQKFPDFANKYNAYAFFNVVWEPHSLAIWTLSSEELSKALEFHKNQKIGANRYLEEHNKRQYEYFINQLEQWLKNAHEREKIYTFYEKYSNEELIDLLVERLIDFENGKPINWINGQEIDQPIAHFKSKFERKIKEKSKEARDIMIRLCTYETERVYMEMSSFSHLW